MTILTNGPRLPGAQPFGALVEIELVGEDGAPVAGYVTGTDEVVQSQLQFHADGKNALSSAVGEWSVDLTPNASIEPAGTVYRIVEQRGRSGSTIHIVSVPATGGPYTILECITDVPGSLPFGPLLVHLNDATDAHDASAVSVVPSASLSATTAQAALDELAAEATTEAVTRSAADTALASDLTDESVARIAADDAEEAARIDADADLLAEIISETNARTAADLALAAADTVRIANQQVGNYTLVLSDAGKAVEGNAASALSFTVPPNSSVAYPTGTIIEVVQVGAGAVTLVPGSGVTITGDTVTPGQGGSLLLRKTGTDAWFSAIASVRSGTFAGTRTPGVAMVAADTRAAPNVWFPEDYAEDGTGGILAALTAALASGSENIVIQLQEREEDEPYLISGALQTDREGNAQIPLPFVAYPNNGPAITIQGPTPMDNYFPGGGQKGAIIESTLSGATFSPTNGAPSVIGGPTYQNSLSGGQPRFTYINVTLRNLVVVVPAGAPLGGIDLDLVGRHDIDGVAVFAKRTGFTADFSDAFTDPSANPHGFGIRLGRAGNYGKCRIGKTGTYGVYAGLVTNEHSDVRHHISKWCKIGWVPSTGTPGHAQTATKIGLEWCTYSVSGWSEETGVIDLAALTEVDALIDIERPPAGGNYAGKFYQPVTIVNDPLDMLAGNLRYYAGDGAYTQVGTSWRAKQTRLRTAGNDVRGRLDHKDFLPTSIPNVLSSTAYALDPAGLILNFRAPLSGRVTLYWELFAAVAATTNLEVGWLYSAGGVATTTQVFSTMEFASNGGGLYLCTSRLRTKNDFSPGVLYQVMLAVRNVAGSGTIAIPNDNIHIEAVAA